MDDINYEAVVLQLQVENEFLRTQARILQAMRLPRVDLAWFRALSTSDKLRLSSMVVDVAVIVVAVMLMIKGFKP